MTSIKLISLFLFFPLIIPNNIEAQNYLHISDSIPASSAGDLTLKLENSNFIKNNEYFNKIVEGYTLIGFWITPTLRYQISEKSAIEAGTHVLKFSGRDKFFKAKPVFRVTHEICDPLQLILGTIKNNSNHSMPAPMFDPERFYFNQADNGIQFVFTKPYCTSDLWLTWDNFVFYGDTVQEQITSGLSSKFILPLSNNINLDIPVYVIITHRGGQVNRPKLPIETLINLGSGFELEMMFDDNPAKKITLSPRCFYYSKNTSDSSRIYNNGWAFEPTLGFRLQQFSIEASYWYSNKFIGPRGEAIYQPVSTVTQGYSEEKRELLIGKFNYSYQFPKHILLSAGFEGYYDQIEKIFDYNFSLHINCVLDWKLGSFAIRE